MILLLFTHRQLVAFGEKQKAVHAGKETDSEPKVELIKNQYLGG